MAAAVLEVAGAAIAAGGPVEAVGIANQRASTILWDRTSGRAVGPGIGWQDLRTVGMCLMLRAEGIRLAPNQSATKLAMLLDLADPGRSRDLCFGTVDSYVAFILSNGRLHVTDHTNAGVTGLVTERRSRLGSRPLRGAADPAGRAAQRSSTRAASSARRALSRGAR